MTRSNLVLIGMMGSGKTTVGKLISHAAIMDFIDLDEKIENRFNMPIPRIFKIYGESFFRDLEAREAALAAALRNTVIATGGGAVTREENMEKLKKTGILCYLRCGMEILMERVKNDESRPLFYQFQNLYPLRDVLYNKYCDFSVDSDAYTPEETAEQIMERRAAYA